MQTRGHLGRLDAGGEVHEGNRAAGAHAPAVNHHRCAGRSGREVPGHGQSATPVGDVGRVSVRREHYIPRGDADVDLAADGARRRGQPRQLCSRSKGTRMPWCRRGRPPLHRGRSHPATRLSWRRQPLRSAPTAQSYSSLPAPVT